MRLISLRYLFSIFFCFFLLWSYAQTHPETGNIEVVIQEINTEEEGELVILLFNSESTWLEYDQQFKMLKVKPSGAIQKVMFEDIPYDTHYAIEIVHDENNNQKLDMRILPYPKPKEGFGLSNNTFRAGPPEYEKAKFSLDQPTVELVIQMKY